MIGLLFGVTVANGILDNSERDSKALGQIAETNKILLRQAKRQEMREFLNARGLVSTDDVLSKFRYD